MPPTFHLPHPHPQADLTNKKRACHRRKPLAAAGADPAGVGGAVRHDGGVRGGGGRHGHGLHVGAHLRQGCTGVGANTNTPCQPPRGFLFGPDLRSGRRGGGVGWAVGGGTRVQAAGGDATAAGAVEVSSGRTPGEGSGRRRGFSASVLLGGKALPNRRSNLKSNLS